MTHMFSFHILSFLLFASPLYGKWWSISGANQISAGKDTNSVAWAFYEATTNSTGWAQFSVTSSPRQTNQAQAFGAGYLEGYLTADLIWMSWNSTLQEMVPGGVVKPSVYAFFHSNWLWMQQQVKAHAQDAYWTQVALLMAQLEGIAQGYQAAIKQARLPARALSLDDILLLNSDGDMGTLVGIFYSPEERQSDGRGNRFSYPLDMHCSVLIKLADDFSELYAGHATWGSYPTMLRIYKTYNLQFDNVRSKMQTFSSYPAYVSSNDDFYITDQGLMVTETTNDVWNASLIALIKPTTLLSWARAVIANRLSTNGAEWTKFFSQYNSGTYNNQWMVLDYKLFRPKEQAPPNLLWIVEQLPGYCHAEDVTSYLSLGYWPSYNVPFFADVYAMSGYPAKYHRFGDLYSYDTCPRAKIFRRNQSQVYSFEDFKHLMRYNNYKHDPFSMGNPSWTIASRYDLSGHGAFGALDAKLTSSQRVKRLESHAISGPSNEQQPTFSWSAYPNIIHTGQPNNFDFPWVDMKPIV